MDSIAPNSDHSASPQYRKRPALLACNECRRKHLRCDGTKPICARCASATLNCTYLPSRRGLPRRQHQLPESDRWHASRGQYNPLLSPRSQDVPLDTITAGSQHPLRAAGDIDASFELSCTPHSSLLFSAAEKSYLIGLYYSHFHRSHPMLVPRANFAAQEYPDLLVIAACLIGQRFASFRAPESALPAAIAMAQSAEGVEIRPRIQAFILLALTSLGSHEMDLANTCLDYAVRLAIESKLDRLHSCLADSVSSTTQESLRRTWWELFAIDALLALLQGRAPMITTSNAQTLPFVPVADELYELGDFSSKQPSYAEFERRLFLRHPDKFCSHFYRIQAVLIVRRVQPLFTDHNVDSRELEAVCNDIASWSYHLADSSFALPDSLEDFDQTLIQAHLLVQIASIFLHFPRSHLPSCAPFATKVTCLGKGLERMERSTQHGSSAIAASRELCRIASVPCSQATHSPMTICAFLLGSAVQLSSASINKTGTLSHSQPCRHRVVLMLSALKQIGKAWSSGLTALHHIQPFVDLVFSAATTDNGFGELNNPSSNAVNAASNFPADHTTLEGMAGQNDHELDMETVLQDDSSNINWLEFFQSVDPSNDLSTDGIV
jgi:hypothetical protein